MIKIATWNVNSIKARLSNVLAWLQEASPDILLLQELKTLEENFPRLEIEALGYNVEVLGQKSYNGVAILSKGTIEDVVAGLPGNEEDPQARYLEAQTLGLRVASIYLPNGNPLGTEKFTYKIEWMDHLRARARTLLAGEEAVVLGGDYNVIPSDDDVFEPARFVDDALCQPESRQRFRSILYLGYTEAFRALDSTPHVYSYWDYQAGAWQRNNGVRIDHLLLSPQAADRLQVCRIDKGPRGKEKASDHTPVWCELTP